MSGRHTRSLCLAPARPLAGRRLQETRFERRSALPLGAACLVANAARETLGPLLGQKIDVRLTEPVIPDAATWSILTDGALLFCVRGVAGEAAIVLRSDDACSLAAAAFGEAGTGARPISPIESEVLDRIARALAGCFTPLCGPPPATLERILDIAGYVTYFELLIEANAAIRIGVALSRDPVAPPGPGLRLDDLAGIEVEAVVEFAQGLLPAGDLLNLRPGTVVPMMTKMGEPGRLKLGSVVLARGDCGAIGERSALVVVAPVK